MIKLPILWNNDEDEILQGLGLPTQVDYSNVRMMTFFNINAISPHYENDKEFTLIHCNNNEFMCMKPIKEVEKIINEWMNQTIFIESE